MIKSVLRILAVLTALLLAASIPAVSGAFTMNAYAADEPEFTLECSSPDVRTGDIITVTLYVSNTTGASVSAFDGSITFNSSHFSYYDFSYPANMTNRMTCIDHNAASSSVVNFTFADTTKTVIPNGTTKLPLLYLRFMAVSRVSGTGQLSCEISSCYSGLTAYEDIAPLQLMIPVSNVTTASTTTQSTTSSTQPKILSSDAHLQSLTINYGTLSPAFNPEFVAYTATVDYLIATVRISATPSSGGAIVMGSGVKELGVGQNTFTITVTAEDGSTMHYGIVITRLPEESTVPVSTEPTTVTSVDDDIIVTLPPYDVPTTQPIPSSVPQQDNKVIEGGSDISSDNGTVKVIGIIFAEVALFMFGFLAGFFLDKNMKKKDLAELAYGPLDRGYPQQPPAGRYPEYPQQPQQPMYPPEPDYSGYAPAPEDDGFVQGDNFPQYSVYDEASYDEYGNPIDNGYQDGSRNYYN